MIHPTIISTKTRISSGGQTFRRVTKINIDSSHSQRCRQQLLLCFRDVLYINVLYETRTKTRTTALVSAAGNANNVTMNKEIGWSSQIDEYHSITILACVHTTVAFVLRCCYDE